MNFYKIYVVSRKHPITFIGVYRRDLETNNWHYYEDDKGFVYHFRKEHIVCVYGDKAENIINNKERK